MEKTLSGIKLLSHLKYLYDSLLFPPCSAGHLWDHPLGKCDVKKSTKGKIIIAGKYSKHWEAKAVSLIV